MPGEHDPNAPVVPAAPVEPTVPAAAAPEPVAAPPEPVQAGVDRGTPFVTTEPAKAPEAAPAATEAKPETHDKSLLERYVEEKKAAAPKPDEPTKPAAPATEAKPDVPKTEEAKPGEPVKEAAPAAELPPIDYASLKAPEGFKAEGEAFDAFRAAANTDRLSPERAQSYLDLHATAMRQHEQRVREAVSKEQWDTFRATTKEWENAAASDELIGGSGHMTSMGVIARMRDLLVPQKEQAQFDEFLRVTGAGSHPAFLKALYRAGQYLDERQAPQPPANPSPLNGIRPGDKRALLYGDAPKAAR